MRPSHPLLSTPPSDVPGGGACVLAGGPRRYLHGLVAISSQSGPLREALDVQSPGMDAGIDAVLLDFNGTLSRDEDLLADCYEDLVTREGLGFDRVRYFADLAGGPDTEIICALLGGPHPAMDELIARRVALYLQRAGDGHTISQDAREAVRELARHIPVAVVSSAYWVEIETVLTAAGLTNHVSTVVAIEDVRRHKPDPACYELALRRLGLANGARAIAVEDSAVGIAAAKGAGLPCLAILGTAPQSWLRNADGMVSALDPTLASEILQGRALQKAPIRQDQRAAGTSKKVRA